MNWAARWTVADAAADHLVFGSEKQSTVIRGNTFVFRLVVVGDLLESII